MAVHVQRGRRVAMPKTTSHGTHIHRGTEQLSGGEMTKIVQPCTLKTSPPGTDTKRTGDRVRSSRHTTIHATREHEPVNAQHHPTSRGPLHAH